MHVAYNGNFLKRKGVGKAHLIFFLFESICLFLQGP